MVWAQPERAPHVLLLGTVALVEVFFAPVISGAQAVAPPHALGSGSCIVRSASWPLLWQHLAQLAPLGNGAMRGWLGMTAALLVLSFVARAYLMKLRPDEDASGAGWLALGLVLVLSLGPFGGTLLSSVSGVHSDAGAAAWLAVLCLLQAMLALRLIDKPHDTRVGLTLALLAGASFAVHPAAPVVAVLPFALLALWAWRRHAAWVRWAPAAMAMGLLPALTLGLGGLTGCEWALGESLSVAAFRSALAAPQQAPELLAHFSRLFDKMGVILTLGSIYGVFIFFVRQTTLASLWLFQAWAGFVFMVGHPSGGANMDVLFGYLSLVPVFWGINDFIERFPRARAYFLSVLIFVALVEASLAPRSVFMS